MRWWTVPLIGVLIVSLGFVAGIREGWFFLPEVQATERFADETRLSFVAFGRQAVDQDEAKVLAAQLERLSLGTGPFAFVLLLGDNFYPDGVSSVSDPVWQSQFFDVYDRPGLREIPFYAVLGNHDHRGNVEAQVRFHQADNRRPSYQLPARFYARDFGRTANGRSLVRIVFLDTGARGATMRRQERFVKKALGDPRGDPVWRIAAGHFALRSLTELPFKKDRNRRIEKRFVPVLKEGGAEVFLSADDRFQQLLIREDEPLHVSTGGPSTTREDLAPRDSRAEFVHLEPGYVRVDATESDLAIHFVGLDGSVRRTIHEARDLIRP